MAKLYFRYGAMNAGKSTALVQVAYNYEERGMQVLILKPATDSKWGASVVSRIWLERKVNAFIEKGERIDDILDGISEQGKYACILVDEVQFLEEAQIDQLFEIAILRDIPVICYGLRTDFLLQTFPASGRLLALAHSIEELKTICRCGRKAVCNLRLIDWRPVFTGAQVAIDGSGDIRYESVCWKCFFKLKEQYT